MSQDWKSIKDELRDVVGKHRAANEPYKNDLWKQHKGKIENELVDFVAMPSPKNASELKKRTEHKDRLIEEWERALSISDAEIGTRGQGGVVRSLYTLKDSIEALDGGSTKLGNRMLWLTWAIAIMTFVMVVDIFMKWGETITDRWVKKPAVEVREAKEKSSTAEAVPGKQ